MPKWIKKCMLIWILKELPKRMPKKSRPKKVDSKEVDAKVVDEKELDAKVTAQQEQVYTAEFQIQQVERKLATCLPGKY